MCSTKDNLGIAILLKTMNDCTQKMGEMGNVHILVKEGKNKIRGTEMY